jgi:hypothetical protein
MCHVDCFPRQYCEDGVVYGVNFAYGLPFPCGSPLPKPQCRPITAFEECEHGCHENGRECADAGELGNAGSGAQGGEGGLAGEGGETNGGAGGDG